MKKNNITNKILFIVSVICLFAIAFQLSSYEKQIDQQDKHIKLLQEELKEVKNDNEYYKMQYKKYFELSEELQNQIGVY